MRHPATRPQPQGFAPHIWREGRQLISLPELARRRSCSLAAARKWAQRRPTVRIGCHLYVDPEAPPCDPC